MKLYFAGCARDCADVVASNIRALLSLGAISRFAEIKIFIIENSSKDNTREVLSTISAEDDRVVSLFLEDLDKRFPVREARIAYCRDRLLAEISMHTRDGLYVPIDLDSNIATSLDVGPFIEACQLVLEGRAAGIFPSSSPYYYDIHALRDSEWCPSSCWKEIQDLKSGSNLLNLLAYIRHISFRQKSHTQLLAYTTIPIDSAFGGAGIYSLSEVLRSGARYLSKNLQCENLKLCEHVEFNSFLDPLFIYPRWVIAAPPEHIEFRMLPYYRKVWRIAQAGLEDMKRLPFSIARRIKNRIVQVDPVKSKLS